ARRHPTWSRACAPRWRSGSSLGHEAESWRHRSLHAKVAATRCPMLRWTLLPALVLFATAASGETPWPLRTPSELKALHGPTFVGMQILTYRRSQEPKVEGTAPQIVIGIGQDIIYREDGQNRRIVDLRLGRVYNLQGARYVDTPIAPEIVFRENELASRLAL